jgi:hypothetical protein
MTPHDNETSPPQPAYQHPRDDAAPVCPVCTTVLNKSYTAPLAVGIIGLGYICRSCLIVYTPDLEPIGQLSEEWR